MKILYITPYLPYPQDEGGKIRIFNLLKNLSKKNTIHFLSLIYSNNEIKYLKILQEYYEKIEVVLHSPPPRNSDLISKTKRALFNPPDLITKRYNAELEKLVKKYISENQYDIICAEQLYAAQYILPHISKLKSTKFVLSEHNIESEIFKRYISTNKTSSDLQVSKWWLRNYLEIEKLKKYENSIWKNIKNIIVVSDRDKQVIEKSIVNNNIVIIPNGVDLEDFNLQFSASAPPQNIDNKKNFTLVYTGSFTHYPNTDAILFFYYNVFEQLKKNIPNIILYVVGKNPYPDLTKLNEDKNVVVTGYVDDVRPYIYNSDLFIVPLRIGGGSRLKILQAMGMGKCILSTTIGAEGIDCKDNENIVIADTADEILNKIITLYKNKELREVVGKNANKLVYEKYDWRGISEKLDIYFKSLIN